MGFAFALAAEDRGAESPRAGTPPVLKPVGESRAPLASEVGDGNVKGESQPASPPAGFSPTEQTGVANVPVQGAKAPSELPLSPPGEASPATDAATPLVPPPGAGGPGSGTIHVQFENDEVSLLVENMSFSDVLNAVGEKAAFTVKVPPDLGSRRISVTLQSLPIERAIVRLFSLVQEKNYTVRYGPGGRIARIEVVHEKRSPSAAVRGRQVVPSRPGVRLPPAKTAPGNAGFRPPQPILQPPPYIPPTDPLAEPDEDTGMPNQGTQ